MLENSPSKPKEIWGIKVPISPSGRHKWPTSIRKMAIERVDAGQKIVQVAKEIGANQSLVAKWVKSSSPVSPEENSFVELVTSNEIVGSAAIVAGAVQNSTCLIQVGDMRATISPGYPVKHLTDIFRAMRAAQ